MKKETVQFQLVRDGELYQTVYDRHYEAYTIGQMLIDCGWIKVFYVQPIKAIWLKA